MATRRAALGRGLSALISPEKPASTFVPPPEPSNEDVSDDGPLYIEVARIVPNPNQPRKRFAEEELSSLAQSIREHGILQPLVVRRLDDRYELIIGERRWRASQLAALEQVPAVILEASDRQVLEMAVVENVQRAELNAIELSRAFQMLIEQESMTQEEVGRRVGLDRSTVANHLRLLDLSTEIQQDVVDQRLTMGHAKALLQAPATHRPRLRDQVVRQALSVRATEALARRAGSEADDDSPPHPKAREIQLVALEDRLRRALQTKVRVVGRKGRGRVELPFFSESDLERIVDRLLSGEP